MDASVTFGKVFSQVITGSRTFPFGSVTTSNVEYTCPANKFALVFPTEMTVDTNNAFIYVSLYNGNSTSLKAKVLNPDNFSGEMKRPCIPLQAGDTLVGAFNTSINNVVGTLAWTIYEFHAYTSPLT